MKDANIDIVIGEFTLYTPPILNRKWIATKYYNSKEGELMDVSLVIIDSLLMEANGRLVGSAGWNSYTGTYDDLTSSSSAISGSSSVTEMFYVELDNIMDQEIL